MNTIDIKVVDTIGGALCTLEEDGQIIFERICSILKNGDKVNINFRGACIISTLFMNTAIGKLYGSFDEDNIKKLVKVSGLSLGSEELLGLVVGNAKKYYHFVPQDTFLQAGDVLEDVQKAIHHLGK